MAESRLTLKQEVTTAKNQIEARKSTIVAALAGLVEPDRFLAIAYTAMAGNPKLLQADRTSLVRAVVEAAQCGLVVDKTLGEGALVPFKGEVVFIPGYKGLVKLAIQSESVSAIWAEAIHERDAADVELGSEPRITHKRALGEDRGRPIAYYAVARMADGTTQFRIMDKKEVDRIRAKAPGGSAPKSAWATDYDEMAKKTVVRRLCKMLPLTPAAHKAMAGADTYLSDEEKPEVEIRDITPEKAPEEKTESGGSPQSDDRNPGGTTAPPSEEEPPDLGDDDAPPAKGKPNGSEPAKEAEIMPTEAELHSLSQHLKNTGRDPREVLKEILHEAVPNLKAVTRAQYVTCMETLAPHELQGDFYDGN